MGIMASLARNNLRVAMDTIQEEIGTSSLIGGKEIQKINKTINAPLERFVERISGFFYFWQPEIPSLPPTKSIRDFEKFLFSSDYSVGIGMFLIEVALLSLDEHDVDKLWQLIKYFHVQDFANKNSNGDRLILYTYKIFLMANCFAGGDFRRGFILSEIENLNLYSSPELQRKSLMLGHININSQWKGDPLNKYYEL